MASNLRDSIYLFGAGDEIRTHDFLLGKPSVDTFINFRKATKGLTVSGEKWLREALYRFLKSVTIPVNTVTKEHIIGLLAEYEDKPWRRHGLYRALNSFFKWASAEFGFDNPMLSIPAPKTPDVILHTMTPENTEQLIKASSDSRTKAIVALLADSGVRRTEMSNIGLEDLDLENNRIKVSGKGDKEGYLIFGERTKSFLVEYLQDRAPVDRLFGLTTYGIEMVLRRLQHETGIKCNAHSFRRGFATALRHAGVGELDIQQLGRWSSLEMVRRYTKAYTFDDAAKRYKPIVT